MEWFSLLGAAAVFAAACNLDTVILAMGWAVRGVRPGGKQRLIIAGLTTLITWLSLGPGGPGRGGWGHRPAGRTGAGGYGPVVRAGLAARRRRAGGSPPVRRLRAVGLGSAGGGPGRQQCGHGGGRRGVRGQPGLAAPGQPGVHPGRPPSGPDAGGRTGGAASGPVRPSLSPADCWWRWACGKCWADSKIPSSVVQCPQRM